MNVRRLLAVALTSASAAFASVDLTLYNSAALRDSDGSTPLEGTSSAGDLVQLILVGTNGVIDPPFMDGSPGGDDALVTAANNPTYVGAGLPGTNTGFLAQGNMVFADALVGAGVYVRFWNGATPFLATHYGDSTITNLPAADGFGQAELDFVPTASHPRTTDQSFTATEVPTLTEWGLIALFILLAAILYRNTYRPVPESAC